MMVKVNLNYQKNIKKCIIRLLKEILKKRKPCYKKKFYLSTGSIKYEIKLFNNLKFKIKVKDKI